MILIAININILILVGLKTILGLFLPSKILTFLGIALLVILTSFSIVIYFLNLKRFHDNEKIQYWYFKTGQAFNKINYNILYYPVTRITYLFVTNSSIKKFTFATFGLFFAISIIAFSQMINSNLPLMSTPTTLVEQFSRTDRMKTNHYESNLDGSQKLLSAVIPSEKINDNLLKVFVPVFFNEGIMMDSLCGEWQKDEKLNNDKNLLKRRMHWLNCAHQYHQFYVNDNLYTSELMRFDHPNQGENGVLTYLPTEKFKLGKNILRIEKVKKDGSVYRTIRIPFWF
jgi:hypothetical protein